MTIYVDLDGVLADYDKRANQVLGEDHYKYDFVWGSDRYWQRIHEECPMFFLGMDKMPDADELWYTIRHLSPVILTALPKTNSEECEKQKRRWVEQRFPEAHVITCFTKDKPNYCDHGDMLIDDRAINAEAWRKAGGNFILHANAKDTLRQLRALGIIT